MHLWPWGTSYSPMKAVRSRLRASVSFPGPALICGRGLGGFSASLVSTGASVVITSRDSSELGFWTVYWSSDAQMRVGQPCTPTNVVWKGGLVRNLPDRDQQRGRANLSIMRPTTADSLG